MRITKLSLTNFRSFSSTQTIAFSPVTLVFGPNSVGKSSILMALFYLQQVIDKGQANPTRIEALKSKQLEGFISLVNGKDYKKDITLKIELDKESLVGKQYSTDSGKLIESIIDDNSISLEDPAFLLPSVAESSEKIVLEFVIGWSSPQQTACVKNYRIWADDAFLGELTTDVNQLKTSITKLNYQHPLLRPLNHQEWLSSIEGNDIFIDPTALDVGYSDENFHLKEGQYNSLLQQYVEDKTHPDWTSLYKVYPDKEAADYDEIDEYLIPSISIDARRVGLPYLQTGLKTAISEPDIGLTAEYLNYAQTHSMLSEVFVSSLDNLNKILANSVNIGPLRTVPDSSFIVNPNPEQKHWYDGSAAWDLLAQENKELNSKVNSWLFDKDKLDTGYSLSSEVVTLKKSLDKFQKTQLVKITSKDPFLFDHISEVNVWPSEVGVGIAQLTPLLVAAHHCRRGVVAIEQPELHIHPRLQVAIGDLFTQIDKGFSSNFLIETHSEHLILRLLRRVRETTSGQKPSDKASVTTSDISVIYLSRTDEGVVAKKYEVTPDGDFIDEWEDGFFDERDEELF
jgi:predicted ATPase